MKKKMRALFLALLILWMSTVSAMADAYPAYTYSTDRSLRYDVLPGPDSHYPVRYLDGQALGAGFFRTPSDLFVSDAGNIYVADTGNNRIVRLDAEWNYLGEIIQGGDVPLNAPEGIFVNQAEELYIADTGNGRVLHLNAAGEMLQCIDSPESEILPEDFRFRPKSLVVNDAGVLFVVSKGMFEGIMEFGADGVFTGLSGANKVNTNLLDYFWKRLATQEQRNAMALFVPTEFDNIDIDPQGFVYTVTGARPAGDPNAVRRQSTDGTNMIRSLESVPLIGDLHYPTGKQMGITGESRFVDVAVWKNGLYSCLDMRRGRIFTYDYDGNLLFIFGGLGNVKGLFQLPAAIDTYQNQILVLDRELGTITVFQPTYYGSLIITAQELYNAGKYDETQEMWREVLTFNSNYELAYTGIGKALFREGRYREAMEYFELGRDRINYSKAFTHCREEMAMTYFGVLVLALLVLIGGRAVWRRWFQKTKEEKPSRFGLVRGFRYGFTILRHPFEGYYRMRREGQGTFSGAAAILGLAMLLRVVDSQFGSFLYNRQDLSNNNLLYALLELAVPVALFTVSNWCLTTLMEGEGRMQDIFKAVCYALLPYVLVSGLTFCLGHVLNYDERMFISVLHSLGLFWMVFLIFAGMLSIHQYPAGKTILSILGTLVVMAIIIFIAALFFALLQQLISFVYSIYQELSLRM